MKVMFVIPSMAGGGAERVISVLSNAFIKKGIETKIMMTAGNACAYALDPEVELLQAGEVTSGSIFKRVTRIVKMRQICKANRDAVLVAFEPDAAFFAGIAKAGLSMKMIASERNDPRSFGSSKVRKYAYRWADKMVFQTKDAMEYFNQDIQRKGSVIPNPISDTLPEPYEGKRKKTIVSVGRLEKQKNHKMLLKAFAEFIKKYSDYTLHLYGDGVLREELMELTAQLNMEENVVFEGFQRDVLSRIRDDGMYVLSSDYEGISNSLLEAMAVGMPVISTDCPCGGSAMCIQNGQNGILIPVGDEKALKNAMLQIAESEDKAQQLGKEAFKIRDRYSAEKIVEEWISVLKEVVQNK